MKDNKSQKPTVTFGPVQTTLNTSGLLKSEVRNAALEGVLHRAKNTKGSGRLAGKVAIITGVGPELAIGTAAARLFAREGIKHLYLLDVTDKHMLPLAETLRKIYPNTKITTIKADAASPKAIEGVVNQAMKEEGHLDILFANAGVSQLSAPPQPSKEGNGEGGAMTEQLEFMKRAGRGFGDIGEEEFMEVMRINALGPFLAIKYASAAMARVSPEKGKTIPGGSIILTASVAGQKANAGPPPYSASKASVISLAQTASYALTGTNIRVNAICPGLIQTDMTKAVFDLAKVMGKDDKMGMINPMLRQGMGEEVAQMALFLASDDSSYVNGQALPVDGGLTASMPYVRSKL